jgi:hypothetical protein
MDEYVSVLCCDMTKEALVCQRGQVLGRVSVGDLARKHFIRFKLSTSAKPRQVGDCDCGDDELRYGLGSEYRSLYCITEVDAPSTRTTLQRSESATCKHPPVAYQACR